MTSQISELPIKARPVRHKGGGPSKYLSCGCRDHLRALASLQQPAAPPASWKKAKPRAEMRSSRDAGSAARLRRVKARQNPKEDGESAE